MRNRCQPGIPAIGCNAPDIIRRAGIVQRAVLNPKPSPVRQNDWPSHSKRGNWISSFDRSGFGRFINRTKSRRCRVPSVAALRQNHCRQNRRIKQFRIAKVPDMPQGKSLPQSRAQTRATFGGHEPVRHNNAGGAAWLKHLRHPDHEGMVEINPPGETKSSCQILSFLGSHDLRPNIRRICDDEIEAFVLTGGEQRRRARINTLVKCELKKTSQFKLQLKVGEAARESASSLTQCSLVGIKAMHADGCFCTRLQLGHQTQQQLPIPHSRIKNAGRVRPFNPRTSHNLFSDKIRKKRRRIRSSPSLLLGYNLISLRSFCLCRRPHRRVLFRLVSHAAGHQQHIQMRAGGHPLNDVCLCHLKRGCPILASFARACPERSRRGGQRCRRYDIVYATAGLVARAAPTFSPASSAFIVNSPLFPTVSSARFFLCQRSTGRPARAGARSPPANRSHDDERPS